MFTRRAATLLWLLLVASFTPAAPSPADLKPERFQLDNGLAVLVRPVQRSEQAAILVLYRIGGDHDPKGQCGLAHLIEHLYITAAAGTVEARTFQEFAKRYSKGWEAFTGDRFTILATVFPSRDLDLELRDAADRMGDLRITKSDLDREYPRIDQELHNMFERIPALAAFNNARELLRPTPQMGRRGGVMSQIKAISLTDVHKRWQRYYKPRNATLIVAGGVKAPAVHKAVLSIFAKLPEGQKMPPPSEPGKPQFGKSRELAVKPLFTAAKPHVCLAYAAPRPDGDYYAPYLVLAARLMRKSEEGKRTNGMTVHCVPLIDPEVVSVTLTAMPTETARRAVERTERLVAEVVGPKLAAGDIALVKQYFGFFLGLIEVPDSPFLNVYGLALRMAGCDHLGITAGKLKKKLDTLTDDDLRRAANAIFDPAKHTASFVTIKN
jgi:zinc protease